MASFTGTRVRCVCVEWRAGYYESRVTHKSGGQVIMRAGYYESRVTHKSLIGDELIGGKAVMKLNNIHLSCRHTCS